MAGLNLLCRMMEEAPCPIEFDVLQNPSSLRRHDAPPGELMLLGIEISLEPNIGLTDKSPALRRICHLTRQRHRIHIAGPVSRALVHGIHSCVPEIQIELSCPESRIGICNRHHSSKRTWEEPLSET
jgi:hypothetical protein